MEYLALEKDIGLEMMNNKEIEDLLQNLWSKKELKGIKQTKDILMEVSKILVNGNYDDENILSALSLLLCKAVHVLNLPKDGFLKAIETTFDMSYLVDKDSRTNKH